MSLDSIFCKHIIQKNSEDSMGGWTPLTPSLCTPVLSNVEVMYVLVRNVFASCKTKVDVAEDVFMADKYCRLCCIYFLHTLIGIEF